MTAHLIMAQAGEDLADVQEQAQSWFDRAVDALPRIGIALGVLLVVWGASLLVRHLLARRWRRSRTPSFAVVMPRLVGWTITGVGVALAVTVAFPSIDPVDVVAGLGIVSIAAGFAFQDVLSNLLSGLLLITRQPFVSGDQIQVGDHEGTVEGITIRETSITTFDGRRVLIPNRDVYQNAISIQTAHPSVRTDLVVGCSYDDDLDRAAAVAVEVLRGCEAVLDDPAPEALFTGFGESTVDLELRYWSDPHQLEIQRTRHQVVLAVKAAFDRADLDIPWPIRTLDAAPSLRRALGADRESEARPATRETDDPYSPDDPSSAGRPTGTGTGR